MPRLRGRRLSTAQALANDELSAREIDVAPLEPADLPCPKPRMGGEQEGEPMAGWRHREDAGDILVGGRVRDLRARLRHGGHRGRAFEIARRDGEAAQNGPEHDVHLAPRLRL